MIHTQDPTSETVIPYPTKRKIQDRLHPALFVIIWSVTVGIGWLIAAGGVPVFFTLLPEDVFMRLMATPETHGLFEMVLFVVTGIVMGTAQRVILNRAFHLRLSRWWITGIAASYLVGFLILQALYASGFGLELPVLSRLISALFSFTMWAFTIWAVVLAVPFWWMFRAHWRHSEVWLLVALVCGAMMGLLTVMIPAPGRFAEFLLLQGIVYGVILGITAIALDRYAKDHESPAIAD